MGRDGPIIAVDGALCGARPYSPAAADRIGTVAHLLRWLTLQLDFGEVGEEKSFVVIGAERGQPAQIERVPYAGGKPLREIRFTLPELEQQAEGLRDGGWLRVTVPLAERDLDLNRKVRHLLGGAVVSVNYELPELADGPPAAPSRSGLGPVELFQLYRRTQHGAEAEERMTAAFNQLLLEAEEASE